jgi:hypothetical protein
VECLSVGHGLCRSWRSALIEALHIRLERLEPAEPAGDVLPSEDKGAAFWRGEHVWKELGQGLTFEIDVGACVSHCCVEAGVAQPLTDRGEVDPCLEKVNRRRVAQRMRMDSFACQCRRHLHGGGDVLLQEISNAEPRQGGATSVEEDRLIR